MKKKTSKYEVDEENILEVRRDNPVVFFGWIKSNECVYYPPKDCFLIRRRQERNNKGDK